MTRGIKCFYVTLSFCFIHPFLDACIVSHVDFIAGNAIKMVVDGNSTICQVKVTTGEFQCEYPADKFDEIVSLRNNSVTLWLNDSLVNSQSITICSRSYKKPSTSEFNRLYRTTLKDSIPPLFKECYFTQNEERAELYSFDNSWVHAYSETDSISYLCTFQESFSEKRLKWCKLKGNCSEHIVPSGQNATLFNKENPNKDFEGTYYAILENEFGRTQSPRLVWKKAFQNRDKQDKSIHHNEGDQVTMACNIQSSIPKVDPSKVTWVQIVGDTLESLTLGRTMVRSLDGFLVIFDASPDMNGTYACELRNEILGETMIDNPTELTVSPKNTNSSNRHQNVKFLNIGHKETVYTVRGKLATLQCLFRGRPEPKVFWYKGDSSVPLVNDESKFLLQDGNMTLAIMDVTKEDARSYKCQATDTTGNGEYRIVNLIVQEPPHFSENLSSVNASRGGNATFHCKYGGDPKPSSTWMINGKEVGKNQRVQITEFLDGSKLEMFNVDENSTSSVQCRAANEHGESNIYAYLKVFEPTEIVKFMETDIDDQCWKSICKTFVCDARTDPRTDLRIVWLANNTKISALTERDTSKDIKRANKTTHNECTYRELNNALVVSCMNLIDTLEITCSASNGISADKRSYSINLNTLVSASSKEQNFLFDGRSWVIYAAIGGSCLLVLLISAVILAIRKNIHRGKKAEISQSQMSVLGSHYRPSCSDESSTSNAVSPHLKKDLINIISSLLVPRSSLELKKCIGNGHFGRVYMAALVHGRQICEIVAVKTMKYKAEESEMVELFLKEAVLMKDFQHQHVLGIKGITFAEDATPMVVLPYMANGDLRNYILNPELNITILNLLIMGMQVACGMDYLSKRHFVHRDLAARNCMVNENGVVKIADFGMSRQLISCDYYRVENGKDPVPIRWMAPECLEAKIFTTKSDVWAYGVLLWELMTRGAVPYPDAENWQVASLIQSGCLLRQPPFCPNVVYSMMTRCWIQDSSKRPSFEQLLEEMEAVVNVVPGDVRRDSISYNNVFTN